MLTLALSLGKSPGYLSAREIHLRVTQRNPAVPHNTATILASITANVEIDQTCAVHHCWKASSAFQRQTPVLFCSGEKTQLQMLNLLVVWNQLFVEKPIISRGNHSVLIKPVSSPLISAVWSTFPQTRFLCSLSKLWVCKIVWTLPLGINSPQVLGDGGSCVVSPLKVMTELPLSNPTPPTPPIFVFCSHFNSSENRALQSKQGGKCSTSYIWFYFVHSLTGILKTLSF